MSRVKSVKENMIGSEDPDDLMLEIIDALEEGEKTPEPGEFYIFVYNPKTPNIRYDQNPLVAVTAVYEWGFKGINFHWNESRQYTWGAIAGGLYQVNSDELNDLDGIPFAKFRLNN